MLTRLLPLGLLAGCGDCPWFEPDEALGRVQNEDLVEASGLVASRAHPGVWWAHNDAGDVARLFALGPDGADLGVFDVTGAVSVDWEDVAIAPEGDGWALLVGDIGDNDLDQPDVVVWHLPEPDPAAPGPTATATPWHWAYPDGPHDAETLLLDPRTGDAFVVTKDPAGPRLYRAAAPLGDDLPLEDLGPVALGSGAQPDDLLLTGGDVSADGAWVVLRAEDRAWLWARAEGATLAETLATPGCPAPLAADEDHGEAIGWEPDGAAYVTVGEGEGPTLWRFAFR